MLCDLLVDSDILHLRIHHSRSVGPHIITCLRMLFNKLTQLRKSISAVVSPALRARIIGRESVFKEKLRRTPMASLVRPHLMEQYLRRPEEVDIEVTSVCDADCIMCPRRSMSRRPEAMP